MQSDIPCKLTPVTHRGGALVSYLKGHVVCHVAPAHAGGLQAVDGVNGCLAAALNGGVPDLQQTRAGACMPRRAVVVRLAVARSQLPPCWVQGCQWRHRQLPVAGRLQDGKHVR